MTKNLSRTCFDRGGNFGRKIFWLLILKNWESLRHHEFQEPTLRRESTVRRENLSGESHGDGEEVQLEETKDDEGINKDFWAHAKLEKNFIYRHHIEPWSSNYVPTEDHSLFPRLKLLNETPPRRNVRCGKRIGEAKTSEAKTNSIVYDIAVKGRNDVLYCNFCARIRSHEKISESKHMLSRLAAQRTCETKFFKQS